MAYRAVLFDLDGTLLDTIADLAHSMNSVLHRIGYAEHALEAYKLFVGDGMENLVRRALPEHARQDPQTVAHCLSLMRAEYGRRWQELTRPYRGISELLDALSVRGIHMAILSNKPDDFTRQMAAELLSRWCFEQVLGERASVPRKPDPAAALEIATLLGIPSHEFLYLGDTGTDMRTATAAGMYAVGALWGFRSAGELITHGAKVLIQEPEELLQFL